MDVDDEGFDLIQPTLIQQLKSILDQYPDDGQILKELIQNAEDAGAKRVKFLHDKHSYPKSRLHNEGLAQFQGPALYAYNSARFSKEDWRGIRMLCDSIKVKDPMKVGRFGLGFKSVFHVTDLPSIFSDTQIGVIDPHEEYFADRRNRRTGYHWRLREDREAMNQIPDQFLPYKGIFDSTDDVFTQGSYNGTLFRFPLRTKPSELSKTLYSEDKLRALFESFMADAHLVLLFLQHIESIELYVREEGEIEPRRLFQVKIADDSLQVVQTKRMEFKTKIGTGEVMPEAVAATFPISVETLTFDILSGQEVVEAKERYTFLVSNYFCGGEISSDFKKLVTDKELSYLPCVGVAMPFSTYHRDPTPEIQGHVFCFLPLPVQKKSLTGLPVHVNGFFALSQNRRHVKCPSAEQEDRERAGEKLTDKSLLWNKCLLEEAVPKAYSNLLMEAITERSFDAQTEAIFRAWPDVQSVDPNWKRTLKPVFEMLFAKEVIYTHAHGGKWLKIQDAIFEKLLAEDPKTLILDVLLSADQNVVCLPRHVLGAIDKFWNGVVSTITPALVRRTLKDSPSCYKNRTGSEKRHLLKFTLKDENHPGLIGLELLPVSNGDFTSFLRAGHGEPIYISSTEHPRELLPGLQHRFVDKSVDSEIAALLQYVANQGHTQLRHLRKDDVVSLLPRALPTDWCEGTELLWYFLENHPPKSWLELVWEYLRKNFTTADDLRRLENLPLIPLDMSSQPGSLTRLSQPSRVIVRKLNDDRLDDDLVEVLKLLGVIVMQEVPPFLGLHPAVLENFVHPPSVHGVISVLMVASSQMVEGMHSEILLNKVTRAGKRTLRSFLAKASTLKSAVKQYLAQLPLLETTSTRFVAKQEGLCAAPIEAFPVQPKKELISIQEENCKRFACLLDVTQLQVTEYLCKILFTDIKDGLFSEDEIDKLMTYIIDRFSFYNSEDSRFKTELSLLPFVPKHAGRVRASELFDPSNETLRKLFSSEDVFPTGDFYNKPSVLVLLKDLGLKGESDVCGHDLYKTAEEIQNMSFSSGEMKSKALMAFLCNNPSKLQERVCDQLLGTLLQMVSWVPRLKERPQGLPRSLPFWAELENERRFYKPVELISSQHIFLLGSVKPVVEVKPSSPVAKFFGWQKSPGITDVIAQLQMVTKCYNKDEKPYYMVIVEEIYSFLNNANMDDVKQAYQSLRVEQWVWNGDGFSSPKLVLASKPQIDLAPYICPLPSEVSRYSKLFSSFGMRAECDEVLLLQVLGMIKTKHDSQQNASPSEVKRDLQLSVDILNEVKPDSGGELSPHLQEMILIPTLVEDDSRVRLEPVGNCMYCEHEWLRRDNDDEDIGYFYVHPNIPNSTADRLGVPTLANRMLDSDELCFGEEFGQEEKLTRRLNRILEDYTDGFAVPKELIQNADDAGATEVKFLYDERTNEEAMTCLIDEAMRECQGPALWVYNDAKFQDKDFENITKLNGGTKESDTEKIGKFGLGFNAVYNLTDVPSFVSRNYIAIFDPHTLYLGKAIKGKPGIKIDTNKNVKRLRKFRNQFKPFNGIFGCDLHLDKEDNSFDGSLFRFPLRTREQAIKSEIKQLYYDDTQMRELLDLFIRGARSLLLFTQNVRQVSILSLTNAQRDRVEPKLIFQVKKALNTILRELPVPVTLPTTAERLSATDKDLLRQCNFLRASSEVAKCTSSESLLRSSLTIDVKCSLTEDGEKFFSRKSQACDSETWIVASSMGKGQALQYSRKDPSLIPAAGVAVQVFQGASEELPLAPVTGGEDRQHQSGTLFCYLPLPIRSGLPVNVNGAFSVASNRRHLALKTDDDKTCIGVEWNNVLFQDSICSAYMDLLEDIKRSGARCQDTFYSLWPTSSRIEIQCKVLLESFYKAIAVGGRSIFTDGERWVDFNNVVFLHPEVRAHPLIGKESLEVLKVLVKEHKVVVDLPSAIFKSFEDCGLKDVLRDRCYDKQRLFRDLFFPNISSVPPRLRDALTLYVLDDFGGELDYLLRNYACIPSCPRGERLKRPGELISPGKKAASLFSPDDERFPCGSQETFLSTFRVAKLEQLGMLTDDLPWDQIAERAESISKLYAVDSYAALKRGKALIAFLKHKLWCEYSKSPAIPDLTRERILEAKFLPVLKKPEQFPLQWKGNDLQNGTDVLQSPKNVFLEDSKYLVCCSEPLVSAHIPEFVKGFLKLDQKLPNLSHVTYQLSNAMSPAIDRNNAVGWEEVKEVCKATYSYLQDMVNKKEDQIVNCLEGKKFILIGTQFVSASQVAFDLDVNCSPYLYQLPSGFAKRYHRLMKVAGVRQNFQKNDFVAALKQLKEKFGDTSLSQSALKVALNLADLLAKPVNICEDESKDMQGEWGTVFLPDSEGVMQPLPELCIKDCPWIVDDSDVNFVHNMIPWPVCLILGVKTRREEALKDDSFGISFGQREKLTNRLKRILTGYPCEKEILKELLQNADDAQATEIRFIKDPRHHPDERVFGDSWKPLQGPALCVYNNKPFTKADIEGIQNLGEGSKGDDPNKTGQYGVGFNAVYHLTDVPSFQSNGQEIGDVLCVFDPHCKYVPRATQTEPGRMYTNTKKHKKMFPDVFRCYLEDHFPSENATMFRFPLRTEQMAMENKISGKSITIQQLDEMMRELKKELFEVLLFVNNVKKISFHDVHNSGKLINAYSVEVVMSEEDTLKRQEFASHVKRFGNEVKKTGNICPHDIKVKKVSYNLHLKDSEGNEEKWFIVQQIGFERPVNDRIVNAVRERELGMLPRGGVAYRLERKSTQSCPLSEKHKAFCFLPLPFHTDLPVHINGHFALDHEARRNLWREEYNDCRSEWNKALVQEVVTSCYLTFLEEVRRFFGLPTAVSAKICVVSCDKKEMLAKVAKYEKVFPPCPSSESYWTTMATSVYQIMNQRELRLLPVVRNTPTDVLHATDSKEPPTAQLKWLPLTGCKEDRSFFNNLQQEGTFAQQPQKMFGTYSEEEQQEKERIKKRTDFEDILLETGFNIVAFSLTLFRFLKKSGVDVYCISPASVLDFFKTFNSGSSLCNVGSVPCAVKQTPFRSAGGVVLVLQYSKEAPHFLDYLRGTPLLLTNDHFLRVFDVKNPTFLSHYQELLPHYQHMFVEEQVRRSIFSGSECHEAAVFRLFSVQAFAANLPGTLLEEIWTGDSPVKWFPAHITVPNSRWICTVWQFLTDATRKVLQDRKMSEESMMSNLKDILAPLSNYCLLPVTEGNHLLGAKVRPDHFLVPLNMVNSALDLTVYDAASDMLVTILRSIGLHEVNFAILAKGTYLSPDTIRLIKGLAGSLKSPQSLISSIELKLKSNPDAFEEKLKPYDCTILLRYFCAAVRFLRDVHNSTLRKLPIFLSTHGSLVKPGNRRVCTLPIGIPKEEMDMLAQQLDLLFLKEQPSLSDLFNFLKFESVSTVDMYCNFILKHFKSFSRKAQVAHLEYIRRLVLVDSTNEEKSRLLHCLKSVEFIPSRDGSLKTASSFYDPQNEVFRTMVHKDAFPPEPFNSDSWLDFLRTIGLVHQVSREHFKRFAFEVEREGNMHPNDETHKKSKVLVTHLFKRENVLNEGVLEAVSGIRFVATDPATYSLTELCGQYGRRNDGCTPYIAFKGAVPTDYAEIVWTTAYLLPKWADARKYWYAMSIPSCWKGSDYCSAILTQLGVQLKPNIDLVATHCRNICSHLVKENDVELSHHQYLSRMSVMEKIYRFLQPAGCAVRDCLKLVPCILVEEGRRFVQPKQVVLELSKDLEIPPFLYGVPQELGQFRKLFQKLGCYESLTTGHCAMVLQMMHKRSGGNKLDPNEMMGTFKAVRAFFNLLQQGSKPDSDLSTLYLPATPHLTSSSIKDPVPVTLHSSTELIFNDAPNYKDRIESLKELFVVDLKKTSLRVNDSLNHKDLMMMLTEPLRPRMLSCVVKEKLDLTKGENSLVITTLNVADSLKLTMSSPQFCRGIIRLVRHANSGVGALNEAIAHSIEDRLKRIEFFGINRVVTELWYNDLPLPGSEADVPYFVEKARECGREMWKVYVISSAGIEETISQLSLTLTEIIADLCEGLLRDKAIFIPVMLAIHPSKIWSLLDSRKIRQDNSYSEEEKDVFPEPGSFIPVEDHHLLNEDFEEFKPGDYVGYELDDPSLQMQEGEPIFIYAVIIEEATTEDGSSQFKKKYKINIGRGKEPIIADAADLYKFHRAQVITSALALSGDQSHRTGTGNRQKTFDDISNALEAAWKLPESVKQKIIKRLYLRWHPDKNPGDEDFCKEAFQHIQSEIARLERGESRQSVSPFAAGTPYGGMYDSFFGFWGGRARRHRSQRNVYRENFSRYHGSWGHVPPTFCKTNPQPREARRWFRQAEADLAAADNDIATTRPSYEWACFKCHQAAEKALKAAQYAADAFKTNVHNLVQISLCLDDSHLTSLAQQLDACVGDSTRMRYPDQVSFPQIPNDVYSWKMAQNAVELARQILDRVRDKVG